MNLRILSDQELANLAYSEADSMTGTAMEAELLRRFEAALEYKDRYEKLDQNYSSEFFDGLAAVLDAHYIDNLSDLRQKLERADKFYDVASDAGDVVQRLANLIGETL